MTLTCIVMAVSGVCNLRLRDQLRELIFKICRGFGFEYDYINVSEVGAKLKKNNRGRDYVSSANTVAACDYEHYKRFELSIHRITTCPWFSFLGCLFPL